MAMPSHFRILIAQMVDASNTNAQVLNVRDILSRVRSPELRWTAPFTGSPDPRVARNSQLHLHALPTGRLWTLAKTWYYQQPTDAILWPGAYWFDELGWRSRDLMGRRVPLIAVLEGLAGDATREAILSRHTGHPVYCSRVNPRLLMQVDRLYKRADHIIAISPFLARVGRQLYGDKILELPLGIDVERFHPSNAVEPSGGCRVIGVGRVNDNKRAHLFIDLAEMFSNVDFVWIGDGERRSALVAECRRRGLKNISYSGPLPPDRLAEALRAASFFVLPSLSEGAPKAIQEACACGKACVVMGYYEPVSVQNGINGFVAMDDAAFFDAIRTLINDPDLRALMGKASAQLSRSWAWESIVPVWESTLLGLLSRQ